MDRLGLVLKFLIFIFISFFHDVVWGSSSQIGIYTAGVEFPCAKLKILCLIQRFCKTIFLDQALATKCMYFISRVKFRWSTFSIFDLISPPPMIGTFSFSNSVTCPMHLTLSPIYLFCGSKTAASNANYICATFIAFPGTFLTFHHILAYFTLLRAFCIFLSRDPECVIRIQIFQEVLTPDPCRPGYILLPDFYFLGFFGQYFSNTTRLITSQADTRKEFLYIFSSHIFVIIMLTDCIYTHFSPLFFPSSLIDLR